jgi:TetR/AcrR family fatty acid metabolism transcriptional regulator
MRGRKKIPDIRAAILGCASEVFAQREFHEVLTEDIASRLGIGKGTIYRYFDSKEALYFATIVEGLAGMHDAVTAALRQPAPVGVVIERLVETVLTYFWTRRDFFILLHRHEPTLDPRERAEWQQQREELVAEVQRILSGALPRGSLGRQNPRLTVEVLLGMIRSASLYRSAADRPATLAKLITAMFLTGTSGQSANGKPRTHPHRALPRRRSQALREGLSHS